MHIDTINPDYINNPTRNNNPGYVVYFGGTNFTDYLSETRNGAFFTNVHGPFVDDHWEQRIIDTVQSRQSPIMLVGFSQGGMDAQNIGSDLKSKGYNVVAVITLASPVITSPSTSYHTLHMTPTGDKVGDDPTLNTISPLWPPFADSYHKQAGDAGQGYEVDLGEKGHQHGNLSIYLDLADKFDDKTTTGYTAIKRAILAFGGGIETGVGPATSSD